VGLRNGENGYGLVTKALHWLTVAAIVGQFALGWAMDLDDERDGEEDRLEAELERREDAAEGDGAVAEQRVEAEIEAREDAFDARGDDAAGDVFSDVVGGTALDDGLSLPEVHIGLGLLVLVLAVARIVWRRTTPLPPWAAHLGAGERRLEAWLEKALLALLVVVPLTGLLLVAAGHDWLPVHVGAQLAFLAAIAGHVGLVLRHTVVRRHRHLARML